MTDLPLDWESGAAARHVHIGLALEKLFASRDVVRGAMGGEWWAAEHKRHDRRADVTQIHPLFRQLTSPNDLALVEVVELAQYLTAFSADPSLPNVIKDLRGPKFWAAFYELAMAYRWRDAGAQVTLAPATAKGAADFSAEIDVQNFVVEVSTFEDDFVGSFRVGLPLLFVEVVEKALKTAPPFVCKVVVHQELAPSAETALRAAAKEVCYSFGQQLRTNDKVATA